MNRTIPVEPTAYEFHRRRAARQRRLLRRLVMRRIGAQLSRWLSGCFAAVRSRPAPPLQVPRTA